MSFRPIQSQQRHGLKLLDQFYQFDDFMASISTMVDLGCGTGEDLLWWASATTRDDAPQPLDIQCTGVDLFDSLPVIAKYPNASYQCRDFETEISAPENGFDVLWCHDAFHLALDPIKTLSKWWHI